jgi:RNA polymerase sigma-70 factor (ECF subfamily)
VDADALQGAIDAARREDERAVAELVAHFEPRLTRYVARSLGEHARRRVDVDLVVQQALFETLRTLAELAAPDETELARRLHQTARSRMRDALRKWRREVGESVLAELGREPIAPAPSSGTVTREDTREHLLRLLAELPAEQAQAVRLCALEELSFVDAGRRVGLSPDAVRKRYERGREALVRRLSSERAR